MILPSIPFVHPLPYFLQILFSRQIHSISQHQILFSSFLIKFLFLTALSYCFQFPFCKIPMCTPFHPLQFFPQSPPSFQPLKYVKNLTSFIPTNMLNLIFLLDLIYLTIFVYAKKKSSLSTPVSKELEIIRKLQMSPVLYLGDRNFSKYILDRPRNYSSVVMVTATAPKYSCSVCHKALDFFTLAAKYYESQYDFGSLSDTTKRLLFFVVEVDDARNLFGELGIETVPRSFLVPYADNGSPKRNLLDLEMDINKLMHGPHDILNEIQSTLGLKITITIDPLLATIILCVVAVLMALFVSIAATTDIYSVLLWYQSPRLWILVSSICFSVGVSGSIFCTIRSAPLYGYSYQGISVFATQGRDQYLLEGIIVALWTLGCAVSAWSAVYSTKLPYSLLRHVGVILSMSLFIVFALQLWSVYTLKTSWYNLKETLPSEVWFWLTGSVKKSSGLMKRLVRMSEYWLFEMKSWTGFRKKFSVTVIDYCERELLARIGLKG